MTANLVLAFDIPFGALYNRDGLAALDRRFIDGHDDVASGKPRRGGRTLRLDRADGHA